jgi:hypothetical protein
VESIEVGAARQARVSIDEAKAVGDLVGQGVTRDFIELGNIITRTKLVKPGLPITLEITALFVRGANDDSHQLAS